MRETEKKKLHPIFEMFYQGRDEVVMMTMVVVVVLMLLPFLLILLVVVLLLLFLYFELGLFLRHRLSSSRHFVLYITITLNIQKRFC